MSTEVEDAWVPGPESRAVGLGAICDLRTPASDGERSQSFGVSEFVLLDNGRRMILHSDRGFTVGTKFGAIRDYVTSDSIIADVLNVVLPDDDEPEDDHPWLWLAELCRGRGLEVTAEDLVGLPYEVVLSPSVSRWLSGSADRRAR